MHCLIFIISSAIVVSGHPPNYSLDCMKNYDNCLRFTTTNNFTHKQCFGTFYGDCGDHYFHRISMGYDCFCNNHRSTIKQKLRKISNKLSINTFLITVISIAKWM